jgi:hypothetical protein
MRAWRGWRQRHLGCFSGMQQSGTEGGSAVSLSRASTPACAAPLLNKFLIEEIDRVQNRRLGR